jgi:polar amino acid transport system substrate-binding protein
MIGGCGPGKEPASGSMQISDSTIFAVPTGTAADRFVLAKYPGAKLKYFNTVLDCALAVKTGKADAGVYDKPILLNIAAKNEGLTVLPELIADDKYGFAVRKEDTALKTTIDEVLHELKADGTYQKMMDRWFPQKGAPAPMPDIETAADNGVFRFGTAAVTEPMSFYDKDRHIVGFDIEFATYVARKLHKKIEISDMEFGAMLPALIAGKVDMIGAGLSITEERAKQVLFSESYYPSGIAVIVRSTPAPVAPPGKAVLKGIEDIRTKRIGVLLGSVHDGYASKRFPQATILRYQTVADLLLGLKTGKTDAIFIDRAALDEIFKKDPEIGMLADSVFPGPLAAGFNKQDPSLRNRFNEFLRQLKENGVLNDMEKRWMVQGASDMEPIPEAEGNGELKVGIVGDIGLPFTILANGRPVGFDVELGQRFAASLGKKYVPVDMQFGSIIAALASRKIDMSTCSMMITDERKKQIDFSDPYHETWTSVAALKKNLASAGGGAAVATGKTFFQKLADSFYGNIILESRYKLILNGLKVTIIISIFAALLGTLIGGLICYMRMSRNRFLSALASVLISLVRGTPVLVLLMIIFYIVFASVNINPVLVAIIAFGINFGAYVSEMFRTSIEGVDKGQREAGVANGFTGVQTFLHIIMPQALRQVLPVYKGEFISLVKMTSIVGYIAVQDLTKASDIIRSRTFDAFFPLLMAALIYLILAWLLTWGLGRIEISVDPKRRRIKKYVEAN